MWSRHFNVTDCRREYERQTTCRRSVALPRSAQHRAVKTNWLWKYIILWNNSFVYFCWVFHKVKKYNIAIILMFHTAMSTDRDRHVPSEHRSSLSRSESTPTSVSRPDTLASLTSRSTGKTDSIHIAGCVYRRRQCERRCVYWIIQLWLRWYLIQ